MDRRAQLAAWVFLAVLSAGAAYVAVVVRPFPEPESVWPLRARYEVQRFGAGEPEPRATRIHEFQGSGWRDWTNVAMPGPDGDEARVTRFDGRDARGVLAVMDRTGPYAALDSLDEVQWRSVDAVHDQRRAPNNWFDVRFATEPESSPSREVVQVDAALAREMADRLGLDVEALEVTGYVEAACPDGTVVGCGEAVHDFRYVYHQRGQVPLFVEERRGGNGPIIRMVVTDLDLGLEEGMLVAR